MAIASVMAISLNADTIMSKLPLKLLSVVFVLAGGSFELNALPSGEIETVALERRQAPESSFCQRLTNGACDIHCQWRVWIEFLTEQFDGLRVGPDGQNFSSVEASLLSAFTGGLKVLEAQGLVGCHHSPTFDDCDQTPPALDMVPAGACETLLYHDRCTLPEDFSGACLGHLTVLDGLPYASDALNASRFSQLEYEDPSGFTTCTSGVHFNHTHFSSEGVQQLVASMGSTFNVSQVCSFLVNLAIGAPNSSVAQNQIQAGCDLDAFSRAYDNPNYCSDDSDESSLGRGAIAGIALAGAAVVTAVGVLAYKWSKGQDHAKSKVVLSLDVLEETVDLRAVKSPEPTNALTEF